MGRQESVSDGAMAASRAVCRRGRAPFASPHLQVLLVRAGGNKVWRHVVVAEVPSTGSRQRCAHSETKLASIGLLSTFLKCGYTRPTSLNINTTRHM